MALTESRFGNSRLHKARETIHEKYNLPIPRTKVRHSSLVFQATGSDEEDDTVRPRPQPYGWKYDIRSSEGDLILKEEKMRLERQKHILKQ